MKPCLAGSVLVSRPRELLWKSLFFSNNSTSQQGSGSLDAEKMVDPGNGFWWWAGASFAQLSAGVAAYRSGCTGRETLMPFKAFAVASLFLGAGATALAGFLHASGIREVNDMKEVGETVRKRMGVPPRESNTR